MSDSPGVPDQRRVKRTVRGATLAAAALVAHQVAGKATRDALFLTHFDVAQLPLAMIASSSLALVASLAVTRALARFGPARVVPFAVASSGLALVLQWWWSLSRPGAAALALVAHLALFGATLISAFWSLVNERFDPYTAKRAIARVGTGAAFGGVAGGVLAWAATRIASLPSMFLVLAGINVVAFAALSGSRSRDGGRPGVEPEQLLASGVSVLRETPYLVRLAAVVGLTAFVEALLDFTLSAHAAARFTQAGDLASFFALFHTVVAVGAFAAQATLVRRSLDWFGLAGTIAAQSLAMGMTAVVGALVPRLATAAFARGVLGITRNSLYRSAYELLYTPLPEARKRATKAIIDVGVDKCGSALGGVVALGGVAFVAGEAERLLFVLAVLAAIVLLGVARALHRGYVSTLAESLRSGAIRLAREDVRDSTTLLTLTEFSLPDASIANRDEPRGRDVGLSPMAAAVADLCGDDPVAARRALRGDLDPRLVPFAIPLLARNDLFVDSLRALRRVAGTAVGTLSDALLDATQPAAVRRRIPRVLKTVASRRSVAALVAGLQDDRFDVRFECGVALQRVLASGAPGVVVNGPDAYAAVRAELRRTDSDPDAEPRRQLDHVFTVLSLVGDADLVRLSQRAIQAEGPLRGTALEYLENVLPDDVRVALFSRIGVPTRASTRPRRLQEAIDELRAATRR